jgi:hypothetical protein
VLTTKCDDACRSADGIGGDGSSTGDRLAARFPLQPRDVESTRRWLEAEAEAARELAGSTRSVQTWLPGVVATDDDPGGSAAFAHDLAEFIRAVRAIETRGRGSWMSAASDQPTRRWIW